MKLPGRWMFSKVKISDIVNSLLNLAEIKFYKVGLVLPCLLWVLQTLNLACYLVTPWVIAWCLALKCTLEPRLLTKILLFWATLKVSSTSAREELFTCFYYPWQQLHIFTHSAPFHLVFNRWQCFTVSVAVLSTKSYMLHLIKLMNPGLINPYYLVRGTFQVYLIVDGVIFVREFLITFKGGEISAVRWDFSPKIKCTVTRLVILL